MRHVTGGKVRDTLAGIFADRDALRFAYQNLNPWLIVLCAACLLLGVASRRLAVPDFMLAASSTVASWRSAARTRKPPSPRASELRSKPTSLDALRQVRARSEADRPPSGAPFDSTPHFARPSSQPPAEASPARDREAQTVPRSNRPPARTATAAEILLARRRGRKP